MTSTTSKLQGPFYRTSTAQLLSQFYDIDGYLRDQIPVHGLSQIVRNLTLVVDSLVAELKQKGVID